MLLEFPLMVKGQWCYWWLSEGIFDIWGLSGPCTGKELFSSITISVTHFSTSTTCLLKGQSPDLRKPLLRWSADLLSHSCFRRIGKEPFSTACILVSWKYQSRIFLHFLFRGKKTPTSRGFRAWLVLGGIHIIMILLSVALLMVLYVKWNSWLSKKRITGFFSPATRDAKFSLNQFSKTVLLIHPLGVQLYPVFSSPVWHHVPYKCCPLYTKRGGKYSLEAEPHTSTVYMTFPLVGVSRQLSLEDFLKNNLHLFGSVEHPVSSALKIHWAESSFKNPFIFKTLKYMLKMMSMFLHWEILLLLWLAPQVFSISLNLAIASWS